MDLTSASPFRLGGWIIEPLRNRAVSGDTSIRLEPRMMRLLLSLAARKGAVVSADELLDEVWPGVIVTPDSVYQAVAALRRLLGDNSRDPSYIVTVPRQGYRMVAPVSALLPADAAVDASAPASETWHQDEAPATSLATSPSSSATSPQRPTRDRRNRLAAATFAVAVLAIATTVGWSAWRGRAIPPATTTTAAGKTAIAVLPLVDLTESMGEEVFADGMTEELIDKISRVPGLSVSPPTASFWFKGKRMTVDEIAAKLGVAYLLEGSVRKSDATMRVTARLVRTDDGFVVWSRTFDRPFADRLGLQDEIAGEVGKALEKTLQDGVPGRATGNGAIRPLPR